MGIHPRTTENSDKSLNDALTALRAADVAALPGAVSAPVARIHVDKIEDELSARRQRRHRNTLYAAAAMVAVPMIAVALVATPGMRGSEELVSMRSSAV
jgi:hypothetical protein